MIITDLINVNILEKMKDEIEISNGTEVFFIVFTVYNA